MKVGLIIFSILQGLIAGQIALAYKSGMLTVTQMRRRRITQGLPLLWHFGIWGDLIIISPLISVIVVLYKDTWGKALIIEVAIVSTIITTILAKIYEATSIPEAHIIDGQHTVAGYAHLIYTAISLTVLLLFFFFTANLSTDMVFNASVLLILHLFLGLHFALGLLQHLVALCWYPGNPLRSTLRWCLFVIAIVFLAWRTG